MKGTSIFFNEKIFNILFKGKSHMKRIPGITILSEKLFTNWIYKLSLLKNQVKSAFLKHFSEIDIDVVKEDIDLDTRLSS